MRWFLIGICVLLVGSLVSGDADEPVDKRLGLEGGTDTLETNVQEPVECNHVANFDYPLVPDSGLQRHEIVRLMRESWEDVRSMKDAKTDERLVNTDEATAILAAAIFTLRAGNIQSGAERYKRTYDTPRLPVAKE